MTWLIVIRIVLAIIAGFSGTVAAGNATEVARMYADGDTAGLDWWNILATTLPAVISFVSGLGVIQLPSWLPKSWLGWIDDLDKKEALELFHAVIAYFRDPNEKTLRRARNEAMDIVLQTCAAEDVEALNHFAAGMAILHERELKMLIREYPKVSAAARRAA